MIKSVKIFKILFFKYFHLFKYFDFIRQKRPLSLLKRLIFVWVFYKHYIKSTLIVYHISYTFYISFLYVIRRTKSLYSPCLCQITSLQSKTRVKRNKMHNELHLGPIALPSCALNRNFLIKNKKQANNK
jgi:hypothetical protein